MEETSLMFVSSSVKQESRPSNSERRAAEDETEKLNLQPENRHTDLNEAFFTPNFSLFCHTHWFINNVNEIK